MRAPPGMAQQRGGQGGLAGAGLAHQAEDLPGARLKEMPSTTSAPPASSTRNSLTRSAGASGALGQQRVHLQFGQGAHGCFSPICALLRPMPSARMLVP